MWQAYGTPVSIQFAVYFVFTLNSAAHINKAVYDRAREAIGPYQENALGTPDTSFILQLPDDVYLSSLTFSTKVAVSNRSLPVCPHHNVNI